MKICIIAPWMVRCGISSYSFDLAQALAKKGHTVYITRLHRFSTKSDKYLETLATRRIPKVDIIHISHEYGLYTGKMGGLESVFYPYLKLHKVPIITTMHCTGVVRDSDRVVSEFSDAVVVHNNFMKEQLGHGPCRIIPHGCNPRNPITKDVARGMLGLPKDKFVVTIFGVIGQYKGHEEVIEALRAVPDSMLLVAGGWHVDVQTVFINKLKRIADRVLPDRVRWLDWIPELQVPVVFGASDVCIINHRFASESGALLTTLGYGKCTLTSNHPAFKEKEPVVMTCNGTIDMAKKLNMLKKDPKLIAEYEERAKRYSKKVSWTNIAKLHLSLYEDLI